MNDMTTQTEQEQKNPLAIFSPIFVYFFIFCLAIIYYEILLRSCMSGGITGNFLFFLCFVPGQAVALTALNGIFKSRANIAVTTLWLLLLSVYYIVQLIYYKNFGSLFSISMIGMGGEALGNFGWAITDTIKDQWVKILLMLIPPVLSAVLSLVRLVPQHKLYFIPRLVLLLLLIPVWFIGIEATRLNGTGRQSAYYVFHDPLSGTDSTAAHLGALTTSILESGASFLGISSSNNIVLTSVNVNDLLIDEEPTQPAAQDEDNAAPENLPQNDIPEETFIKSPHVMNELDFNALIANTDDSGMKELAYYLGNRNISYTNEYTGLFEGYNLIYICGEAFSNYALDENITPTLYKMANNGIVLNNYYNSFKNTTTNGEFAFCTSLWPDLSRKADAGTDVGSFYQSATCYMPLGLGDFFNNMGVNSYGYHNYYGEYYRRVLSWPNLGYTCKFMARGMHFTSSWPASDLEMMMQSVDDYIEEDRFHAYYMTFSGHGPYSSSNAIFNKNINAVKEFMGEDLSQDAYGYMAGNYELDKALEYLLNRLEDAGKLDNTVIVLTGDHYPYNLSDTGRDQLIGHEINDIFNLYKSTCIIYNAGLKEPIETDTYCCNIDILPTILNLFGINYDSRLFMGRDIFADGVHKAVLSDMSFITDMVRYNNETGETVWTEKAAKYTDGVRNNYLQGMIDLVTSEYSASLRILAQNFYEYAWFESGLLSEEDLAEENRRVQQVIQKDAQYNIQDEIANAAQTGQLPAQDTPEENPAALESAPAVEDTDNLETVSQNTQDSQAAPSPIPPDTDTSPTILSPEDNING